MFRLSIFLFLVISISIAFMISSIYYLFLYPCIFEISKFAINTGVDFNRIFSDFKRTDIYDQIAWLNELFSLLIHISLCIHYYSISILNSQNHRRKNSGISHQYYLFFQWHAHLMIKEPDQSYTVELSSSIMK